MNGWGLVAACIFSTAAGIFAYRRNSLSKSGVAGAVIIGTAIFGLGGWRWGVVLAIFFISSTALSHYQKKQKQTVAEKFDKGGQRDFGQVFANGGLGAVTALAYFFWPHPIWWPIFIGAIAAVNADTWATELGTLSRQQPRMITTGKPVEAGTSGGITPWGTAVSLLGGLLIGLTGGLLTDTPLVAALLMGGIGGLAGSLSDSLLGATCQLIYYSDTFETETEKDSYRGAPTRYLRGWRWMSNDWVNFIASTAGSSAAACVWWLFA